MHCCQSSRFQDTDRLRARVDLTVGYLTLAFFCRAANGQLLALSLTVTPTTRALQSLGDWMRAFGLRRLSLCTANDSLLGPNRSLLLTHLGHAQLKRHHHSKSPAILRKRGLDGALPSVVLSRFVCIHNIRLPYCSSLIVAVQAL